VKQSYVVNTINAKVASYYKHQKF